jgi:arylsulfatase A-like enzyme
MSFRPLLLAIVLLVVAGCILEEEPTTQPDVLLVVLDTVRADRLSAYGHDRPNTPYLEGLAEGAGVLFEDCTAPGSWTWPSHASLFTGELPWVHGAHLSEQGSDDSFVYKDLSVTRMREDIPTLAERFAAAGYHTVSLSANAWLMPELGLTRGFQEARTFGIERSVVDAAHDVLNQERDEPLFLFLNFTMAHRPYIDTSVPWIERHRASLDPETAPEWVRPYLLDGPVPGVDLGKIPPGETVRGIVQYLMGDLEIPPEGIEMLLDLYDGEIRVADWLFGGVFEVWAAQRPESVIVVTSDHGEGFGEHGFIEHRGNVYPELLHVPLIVAAPGRLPRGVRIETPVQLQDVYPTLLELAGIEASPPGSLVPVVRGEPRKDPIVAAAWPTPAWARLAGDRYGYVRYLYRVGDEALLWNERGDAELYDVRDDPHMTRNRVSDRPSRVAALLEEARPHFTPDDRADQPTLVLSDEAKEQLRSLGYFD